MTTRQLNIKNRFYYFYNDLINILNFEAGNLKLDKKTSLGLDIYYIGYVDKKPEWNVNSVNPLYLMINRLYGTISEKNGEKYLIVRDVSKSSDVLKNMIKCFLELDTILKKLLKKMVNLAKTMRKLNLILMMIFF